MCNAHLPPEVRRPLSVAMGLRHHRVGPTVRRAQRQNDADALLQAAHAELSRGRLRGLVHARIPQSAKDFEDLFGAMSLFTKDTGHIKGGVLAGQPVLALRFVAAPGGWADGAVAQLKAALATERSPFQRAWQSSVTAVALPPRPWLLADAQYERRWCPVDLGGLWAIVAAYLFATSNISRCCLLVCLLCGCCQQPALGARGPLAKAPRAAAEPLHNVFCVQPDVKCETSGACGCRCHNTHRDGRDSAAERRRWTLLVQNRPTVSFEYVHGQRVSFGGSRCTTLSFPAKTFPSADLAAAHFALPRFPARAVALGAPAPLSDPRSPAPSDPFPGPGDAADPRTRGDGSDDDDDDVEQLEGVIIWQPN